MPSPFSANQNIRWSLTVLRTAEVSSTRPSVTRIISASPRLPTDAPPCSTLQCKKLERSDARSRAIARSRWFLDSDPFPGYAFDRRAARRLICCDFPKLSASPLWPALIRVIRREAKVRWSLTVTALVLLRAMQNWEDLAPPKEHCAERVPPFPRPPNGMLGEWA